MKDIFPADNKSEYLVKERSGAISIAELLNSAKNDIKNSDNKHKVRGLILDYRNAWLSTDLTEVVKFFNSCNGNAKLFHSINIAVVTSDPRLVASTILIRKKGEHVPVKPFSTIEGAKRWINR